MFGLAHTSHFGMWDIILFFSKIIGSDTLWFPLPPSEVLSYIMDLSTENSFVKDKLLEICYGLRPLKISSVMDLSHWKFHLLWMINDAKNFH